MDNKSRDIKIDAHEGTIRINIYTGNNGSVSEVHELTSDLCSQLAEHQRFVESLYNRIIELTNMVRTLEERVAKLERCKNRGNKPKTQILPLFENSREKVKETPNYETKPLPEELKKKFVVSEGDPAYREIKLTLAAIKAYKDGKRINGYAKRLGISYETLIKRVKKLLSNEEAIKKLETYNLADIVEVLPTRTIMSRAGIIAATINTGPNSKVVLNATKRKIEFRIMNSSFA